MLRELHIANLAVIADARIEFAAGLNCFTGATGAGKSLVIGAIELLLGLRGPAEMLRSGVEEGRVSGIFDIRNEAMLRQIAAASDVPASEAGDLLLTRRLFASGRSSASLNGHPITLAMLKQVGELLVDVHGQHDHQYLLRPANQLDVLDQAGNLLPLRQRYHDAYAQLADVNRQLASLARGKTLRQQQLQLYQFQADEIDAVHLDAAEYERLAARSNVLQNLEALKSGAAAAHALLYETDGSVVERMKGIAADVSALVRMDAALTPIALALRDATIQIEEAAYDLSRYTDRLDLDAGELAEVNDRLNALNRVINKYGDAVEATAAYRAELGVTIAELRRAADDSSSLAARVGPLRKNLQSLGAELSEHRQRVAATLSPTIESALSELGMERAKFTVALSPAAGDIEGLPATPGGFDACEFVVQTNPGLSPQPLRKIASGGELSRIMLALKGILAGSDRVDILVFDEIDSNVGGRLGAIIGTKLRKLAETHQVLCITHLPQIAAYADRHLTVRKESDGSQTRTTVRLMDGDDRVQELSEMIGGHAITAVTRAQATELLNAARAKPRPRAKVQG